jgi:cystathionine beta-lyase
VKKATKLIRGGRTSRSQPGTVNLPVERASTVTFASLAEMEAVQARFMAGEVVPTYGIVNMPLRAGFEELLCELEGGHRAVTLPSGLAAVAIAILACVKAGDHVLVVDSVYGPTRHFCDHTLKRFGVETTYYDPLAGDAIAALVRPNTTVVYVESPGSLTFEIQDVPAIARAVHAKGAFVICDNAWATGLYFPAMAHGCDLVVQPATKYVAGHSDLLIGAVVANERVWPMLRDVSRDFGQTTSPDDIYLAMRGLRTMQVRLARQGESGLEVARWLASRPEVKRVLHPALASDPGHALWKRDFTGTSSLFGIELAECTKAQVAAFLDHLELFVLGYSWGGYESLIVPANLRHARAVRPWTGGPLIRLHVGLEDPADLIADLERGFERLRRA